MLRSTIRSKNSLSGGLRIAEIIEIGVGLAKFHAPALGQILDSMNPGFPLFRHKGQFKGSAVIEIHVHDPVSGIGTQADRTLDGGLGAIRAIKINIG